MANKTAPQVEMAKLPAEERKHSFAETHLGYTLEQAMAEAARCIQCRHPYCEDGCPVKVPIRDHIAHIARGDIEGAYELIRSASNLPGICGRVCPWEEQCEGNCVLGKKYDPVKTGALERFVIDYMMEKGPFPVQKAEPKPQRVAVVGAGPAGLSCAADLAAMGYQVTVYEALPVAGGIMTYGIPSFDLPKRVVQAELDRIQALGVKFQFNTRIGRDLTVDDLFNQGYDAVFLGIGANVPKRLGIPGEDLEGVMDSDTFLMAINYAQQGIPGYELPKLRSPVIVVGAGNTAMDVARSSVRLGAEKVQVVYRRSEKEMPARKEGVADAKEEGVEFHLLVNPVRVLDDGHGRVGAVECIRMELGEPDASGRARPVPVPGSEFVMPAGTVITSLGYDFDKVVPGTTPGLSVNKWGGIVIGDNYATSREGVFAGGDVTSGPLTVSAANRDGKKAAAAINAYLQAKAKQAAVPAAGN